MLCPRTYNISQRKPWVGRALLSLYIMATGVRFLISEGVAPRSDTDPQAQWFTSLFSRIRESGGHSRRHRYHTDIGSF